MDKSSRVRIVGVFPKDQLLFSVNNMVNTELYLVTDTGNTTLVMSYRKFVDIVFAELSDNQEMLFYVERVSKGKGFGFKSFLWHIHSLSQAVVFQGNNPIAGFFLPSDDDNNFQLVYIIGPKMVHMKIEFVNKKIKTSTLRFRDVPLNYNDISRWFLCRNKQFYLVLTRKKELDFIKLTKSGNLQLTKYPFEENKDALIPHELALMASIPMNLPAYKFSRGNFYCVSLGNNVGIVEQLYLGFDSKLTFAVSTIENNYYKTFTINEIQPDIPLNFIAEEKIVFLFIVNKFVAFVDFTTSPPSVHMMNVKLAKGPLTDLSTNLDGSQIVVDLNTADAFKALFSIQDLEEIDFENEETLSMIALLCARLPYNVNFPGILEKLSNCRDGSKAMHFFQCFFKAALDISVSSKPKESKKFNEKSLKISKEYVDAVDEMEKEFPSSGNVSIISQFKQLVINLMHHYGKQMYNECPRLALKILRKHNESSLILRSAIDQWVNKYHPTDDKIFIIDLALIEEAKISSAPIIPCICDELSIVSLNIATHTIFSTLQFNHCLGRTIATPQNRFKEVKYWSSRIPRSIINTGESLSSISLSRTMRESSSSTQQLKLGSYNDESGDESPSEFIM